MKNEEVALDEPATCLSRAKVPESQAKSEPLMSGMRFFRNGHWWEIDSHIKGRAHSYYRCKPTCFIESRFYTEMEIKQALEEETFTMQQNSQDYSGRGTGRLVIEPIHNSASLSGEFENKRARSSRNILPASDQKELIKVLLVGSRQAVKKAIRKLHLTGFANLNDWSAFQNRSNSNEVLSILVHKI